MSLCPRCVKEGKEVTMLIEGTGLKCPVCTFSREFPRRMPTLPEVLKIVTQKDEQITELEDEIIELKAYIRKLERRQPFT